MEKIYPKKLQKGDEVRVVAPSASFGIISPETREIARKRFEEEMDLNVTFGAHIEEMDSFHSSSVESRLEDFHAALADSNVKMVITVIGGFNCNHMLKYLDYDLIQKNSKIFIGYSDTTALENTIFAKTGLVTYSGPAYSTFGQEKYFDYTWNVFEQALFSEESYKILPSESWSDDKWYKDQNDRTLIPNDGWLVINEGSAEGTLIGGNLCTLNLLQGTEYMPSLKDTILFIEDDEMSTNVEYGRNLQSLAHLPEFDGVRGIVMGRFQKASNVSNTDITKIVREIKELEHLPVIANVDFGHTSPLITFPVGGEVQIDVNTKKSSILITKH
jgi:muramoyltetrapeptide carboxypeptidase